VILIHAKHVRELEATFGQLWTQKPNEPSQTINWTISAIPR